MADVERPTHWDEVYTRTRGEGVSWFESEPSTSLNTILALPEPIDSVVDVGGGASALVDGLLTAGVEDVTVVDVSAQALALARGRLGVAGEGVQWVVSDIVAWNPGRTFDVWHDRAVFHFLTDPSDQIRYANLVTASVRPGGYAVIATFAPDGPERCSNLPTVRYSAAGLGAAIGPGFEMVRTFRAVHITPSGAEQPFTWVVLRRRPVDA